MNLPFRILVIFSSNPLVFKYTSTSSIFHISLEGKSARGAKRFDMCVVHLWMGTREIVYKLTYTLLKSVDNAHQTYTFNGYT